MVGQAYDVTFTSGTKGKSKTVQTQAVARRDLADGQVKSQLNVTLPDMPLGPTSVSVSEAGQSGLLMAVDAAALTVAPQPIQVKNFGKTKIKGYQAAVSQDGVVYISLDVSDIHHPRVFRAQAKKYPLRFSSEDVLFYNTQGFLMQLLDANIPGLFSLQSPNKYIDSDILQYSRHEFHTHFLQHDERQPHAVNSGDTNWHLDNTPHIDRDYLILAVMGSLNDGSMPAPGATPAFDFEIKSYTLFADGLVGDAYVDMSDRAWTDSYKLDVQVFRP